MKSAISGLIFLSASVAACGSAAKEKAKSIDLSSIEQPADDHSTKLVDSISDLPSCALEIYGDVYYVAAVKKFEACSQGAWSPIDMQGEAGVDGKDGKDGSAVALYTVNGDRLVGYPEGDRGDVVLADGSGILRLEPLSGTYGGVISHQTIDGAEALNYYPGCYFESADCSGTCIVMTADAGERFLRGTLAFDGKNLWRFTGDEKRSKPMALFSLWSNDRCVEQPDAGDQPLTGYIMKTKAPALKLPLGETYEAVK